LSNLKKQLNVAVNTGGTYTDFLSADKVRVLKSAKSATTFDDLSVGMINALRILAEEHGLSLHEFLGETGTIVLGTAIAKNAILSGKGARAAMINTEGFTDVHPRKQSSGPRR